MTDRIYRTYTELFAPAIPRQNSFDNWQGELNVIFDEYAQGHFDEQDTTLLAEFATEVYLCPYRSKPTHD